MSERRARCWGPQKKIIYVDAEDARMALALAVMAFYRGELSKEMKRFYVCQYGRSHNPHYHLTSTEYNPTTPEAPSPK